MMSGTKRQGHRKKAGGSKKSSVRGKKSRASTGTKHADKARSARTDTSRASTGSAQVGSRARKAKVGPTSAARADKSSSSASARAGKGPPVRQALTDRKVTRLATSMRVVKSASPGTAKPPAGSRPVVSTALLRRAGRGPGRPAGPSQSAQLRARMVDFGSQLYAEGGSRALTFGAVAQQCGLTKATVFHYFPNKQALLIAIFESLGNRLDDAASGWFDAPPSSCAARLDQVVSSLVEFYGVDPMNARILCHGLLEAEDLARWRVGGTTAPPIFEDFVGQFVAFVEEGITQGEFYPDRPISLVLAIGGIILFEFMLPARGARFSEGALLVQRKQEIIRLVRRAVVRARVRIGTAGGPQRRGRRPSR